MKIRLSALLLLFALAAVTTGWLADRHIWHTKVKDIKSRMSLFKQDWGDLDGAEYQFAFIALAEGEQAVEIAKLMLSNGDTLDVPTQQRLIEAVVQIWRYSEKIESLFGDDLPLTYALSQLLETLGCDSAQSFFVLSDKLFGNKVDPVFEVPNSPVRGHSKEEGVSLVQLVDKAIQENRG